MSHHSTHLRNLAKSSQDPKTSMDPTHKKHPKSPPFINTTTITTKPHSKPQEPTTIYSPNVQNISNHFSRLYSNHKALSSSNPSGPPLPQAQPSLDTHFQAKPMSISTISDGPVSKNTRKYRRNASDLDEMFPKNGLEAGVKKSIKKSSEESLDTKREIKTDEIKKPTKKDIVVVETKNQEIEVLKRPSVLVAAGGRRRSFCSSKTELADFLSCNGVKVVSADMPPFMQIHAVDFARKTYDSLEKFTAKTLASTLKKVPPLLIFHNY